MHTDVYEKGPVIIYFSCFVFLFRVTINLGRRISSLLKCSSYLLFFLYFYTTMAMKWFSITLYIKYLFFSSGFLSSYYCTILLILDYKGPTSVACMVEILKSRHIYIVHSSY